MVAHLLGIIAPAVFGLLLLNGGDPQRKRSSARRLSDDAMVAVEQPAQKRTSSPAFLSSTTASSTTTLLDDDDDDDDKYERLLDWLTTRHNATVSDKIAVRPSAVGGSGCGAFVTDAVAEGELLFAVPRSACVTLDDALLHDSQCGPALQKLVDAAGPGGNTVALAGFLARERLASLQDGRQQQDVDGATASPSSPYGPYLDTLPWARGVNNQEHILFWSDEDIESKLKGSQCYGEALDLRREVALAIRVLDGIIGKAGSDAATNPTFLFPWQKEQQQPQKSVEGLPEAVKGAFVCLLTRSFQDGDGDEEKLVPLLDMLQHSDEPNVSHVMRKDDGTVEVRARQPLQAGDELMNQYRSELEENMPYHRFFTRFGFVPGIQEPIENLLADKSSIFFPQKAEV